jgi:thiamine-phosphate pyrophosphorylase
MKSLSECRLYTFIDTAYMHGRPPAEIVRELCAGGSDLIQLRAKQSSTAEILTMARAILPITASAGVGLVINDHLAVAQETGAELCHLGQEDFFEAGFTRVSQLRDAGSAVRIGLSTHAPEQAARAVAAGADYVAIGPVYATGTKPAAAPVTLKYVRWAAEHLSVPWFAIGGINLENLEAVLDAGAQRVCVVSAILNSKNIEAACREFKSRISARELSSKSS